MIMSRLPHASLPSMDGSSVPGTQRQFAAAHADHPESGGLLTRLACSLHSRLCEGFQMLAHYDGASDTVASVGKPPGKEPARGGGTVGLRVLWGFVGSAGGVGNMQ